MAQTGYTPIQLYRTTTAGAAPTAGNLNTGELAFNIADADMALYAKNNTGNVKPACASRKLFVAFTTARANSARLARVSRTPFQCVSICRPAKLAASTV